VTRRRRRRIRVLIRARARVHSPRETRSYDYERARGVPRDINFKAASSSVEARSRQEIRALPTARRLIRTVVVVNVVANQRDLTSDKVEDVVRQPDGLRRHSRELGFLGDDAFGKLKTARFGDTWATRRSANSSWGQRYRVQFCGIRRRSVI